MKYDNVDYRHEQSNLGPEIGTRPSHSGGDSSQAGIASKIFTAIFSGIGGIFMVLGILLLVVTHYPLPGMIFFPMGLFFVVLGITIGKSIRSGTLRATVRGIPTGNPVREAYAYASNPAYGASEHDELRARVSEQQRRIDALERRCDALESQINRLR